MVESRMSEIKNKLGKEKLEKIISDIVEKYPLGHFLSKSVDIINGQRKADYGDPWVNTSNIAERWTAHFHARGLIPSDKEVTPADVSICMNDLKICRLVNALNNMEKFKPGDADDSLLDMGGYDGLTAYVVNIMLEIAKEYRECESSES